MSDVLHRIAEAKPTLNEDARASISGFLAANGIRDDLRNSALSRLAGISLDIPDAPWLELLALPGTENVKVLDFIPGITDFGITFKSDSDGDEIRENELKLSTIVVPTVSVKKSGTYSGREAEVGFRHRFKSGSQMGYGLSSVYVSEPVLANALREVPSDRSEMLFFANNAIAVYLPPRLKLELTEGDESRAADIPSQVLIPRSFSLTKVPRRQYPLI